MQNNPLPPAAASLKETRAYRQRSEIVPIHSLCTLQPSHDRTSRNYMGQRLLHDWTQLGLRSLKVIRFTYNSYVGYTLFYC